MWLDRAFVPIRYAFSFSRGAGGVLRGQETAAMGFLDPSWVAVLTGIHGVGFQPVKTLPSLGPALVAVLVFALGFDAWRRCGSWKALMPAAAFVLSAPFVAAVRSGTDDVWLGLWTVLAVFAVTSTAKSVSAQWMGRLALFGLALTGPFGALVSFGLAAMGVGRQRGARLMTVGVALAVQWTLAVPILGLEGMPSLAVHLGRIQPIRVIEAIGLLPVLCALGAMSLFRGSSKMRPAGWALLVWTIHGVAGMDDTGPMAGRFFPVFVLLVWLAPEAMVQMRRGRHWVWVFLALFAIDAVGSRIGLEEVSQDRRVALKESQAMARFLKWRFEPRETVALFSPGALAYHYGGPVIDASGFTESRDVSPEAVLAMEPTAMIPQHSYVGPSIVRSMMWVGHGEQVRAHYDQHSVQHQKKWGLTRARPLFFQYFIRNTLPRLPAHISEDEGNRFPKQ